MIESFKIRLIPYEPEYWPILEKWMSDPAYKFYFRNMPEILNKNQLMVFPQLMNMNVLFIQEKEMGNFVGMATWDNIRLLAKTCQIGFLIDKDFQGRSLTREAYMTFVHYLFSRLGFNKVIAIAARSEAPTIGKGLTAGFKEEAVLKDEFYMDGKFHDELRLCAFNKEFLKEYERYLKGGLSWVEEKVAAAVAVLPVRESLQTY